MFLIKLTYLLAVLSFGILPLAIMWAHKLHKHRIKYLLKWKRIEAIILNIIVFTFSLAMLSVSFFAMVIWLGEIYIPTFKNIAYDNFLIIAVIGLLTTSILIELYYATLPFLQYYLLDSGIGFWMYDKRTNQFLFKIIKWEQIGDFHVKLDYPIKKFTFLIMEDPYDPLKISYCKIDIPAQYAAKIDIILRNKLGLSYDPELLYNDDTSNIQDNDI